MITAHEAKKLSESSDDKINSILSKLEEGILKVASTGNRELACYQYVEWESYEVGSCYREPETTPIQAKIIARLKELGYGAKMAWNGKTYVPPGQADDYGNGPEHQNYVLVVNW